MRMLLALVFAGVVLGFTLRAQWFRRWSTGVAEVQLSALLGERVEIGELAIEMLPLRVTVTELLVSHPETGEPRISLDRGRARLGLRLSGPRILLLELDRPVVDLTWTDGVLQAFPGLAGGSDEPFTPPERLPWDELILRDADATLNFVQSGPEAGPGVSLRVRDLDVRPALAWPDVDITLSELSLAWSGQEQLATDIHLPSVLLTADRVRIPDIELDFPILSIQGRVGAELDGLLAGALVVHVRADELSRLFPPGLALAGDLDLDLELMGSPSHPAFEAALVGHPVLKEWRPGVPDPKVSQYDFGEVQVLVRGDREGLEVPMLRSRWAQGLVEAEGKLGWDWSVQQAAVRGEDLDFASAMIQVGGFTDPWVNFLADLEANVSGTLSPLAIRGPFELNALDLIVASGPARDPRSDRALDVPTVRLAGDLDLGPTGIRLDARQLVAGDTRGRVDAWLGWQGPVPMDLDVDLNEADLSTFTPLYDVALLGTGRVAGRIWGPYDSPRIEGTVEVQDFWCLDLPWADQLSAKVSTDNLIDLDFTELHSTRGQTLMQGELRLSFTEELGLDTQVSIQNGRLYDIMSIFLDVPEIDGEMDAQLTLSGPMYELDGEGQVALRDVEIYGEEFDEGRAHGTMLDGRFTLDELLLWRAQGAESLLARGSVGAGWAMNTEVRSDGLRLETLNTLADADTGLRGRVRLDARVGGTLFSPQPEGRIAARELRLDGNFLPDALMVFRTEDERLHFEAALADGSASAQGELGLFGLQDYAVRYTLTDLPVERLYPVVADGRPVRLRVTGTGALDGAFGDDRSQVLSLSASKSELSWGARRLRNAEPWTLWLEDGALRTEGVRLVGDGTDLVLSASRGPGGELMLAGGGPFDLGWVQVFTQDLVRADGVGHLQMVLSGEGDSLDGLAQVTMTGANLRSSAFPHPFEQVNATIVGTPKGYTITSGEGDLGGGRVVLSGSVAAQDWLPTRYDLHAELRDARVRYVEDLPPMVADASLDLDGRPDDLLLSGDIRVEDMVFSERIDWEQWAVDFRSSYLGGIVEQVDEDDALMDLDLRVVADGTATVRNNIADGVLEADLRVIGSSARPGLVGDVRMQPGGTLTYEDRDFTVTRAELHYIDPWTWDPELDFVLETDIRTEDGSYHIYYPVSGPFSDWRAEPRSDPPMSQGDINALILFGVTRKEIENMGGSSPIALEGLDLLLTGEGQRALDRLGDGVFATTRVELVTGVSARGSVISSEWRVLVQKDITQPVPFTFIGEINPFRLNDQYVALEKRLAGNMYLSVFWSSFQRERNLNIGGAYGADFKVRWDLD